LRRLAAFFDAVRLAPRSRDGAADDDTLELLNLRRAVLEDFEVVPGQIGDGASFLVG
jgi:hypothetical protein